MNTFVICIAGHVIQIDTLYVHAAATCKRFLSDEKPEFCIRVEQRDIDAGRAYFEKTIGDCTLWDGSLEVMVLHNLLTNHLIDRDILLMHGAAIALGNEAYLFSAPSGTGKTTHVYQWLRNCPDSFIINGDKPFIRFSGDDSPPLVCGSPWAGKEGIYTNTMVPLKSIVLMERAEENQIETISFADAFPVLFQQAHRPEDPTKIRKTLQLLRRLDPVVSFWRFQCNNLKPDSFTTAYKALTGREP